MSARLRVSRFVTPGQFLVVADLDHPEIGLSNDPDGSLLLCSPEDEQRGRDLLAQLAERSDVNEGLTNLRRQNPNQTFEASS